MVEILLATYNSATFLQEQLNSIFSQDYQDWKLLVRDGGSEDETLDILHGYKEQYPDKITLLDPDKKTGARENFSILLSASTAAYIMFCDHDDVWLPSKISISISRMKEYEISRKKPLLLLNVQLTISLS